jgi:hypothetical protein
MNTPRDPFSDSFDRIEIDPANAPSPEAFDRALAFCAPPEERGPGFYLIEDGHGRFVVDRDTGVITLRDEAILGAERGQIHHAQLRVTESSGRVYTMKLALRLTGRVPQMADNEDLNAVFFDAVAAAPGLAESAERAYAYDQDEDFDEDEEIVRIVSWAGFTATKGYIKPVLGSEHAPFGALVELWIPNFDAGFASLTMMDDVPPPNGRTAIWTL